MRFTRGRRFAAACAFLLSCALGSVIAAEPGAAGANPLQPRHLNSIARLLAGLPLSHADHAGLASTEAWKSHSQAMQASWERVRSGQLAGMKAWRTAALPTQCPIGQTLFYPFSGPDFLNAYTLFPGCDTYVMFGLESIGEIPDPAAMTPEEFSQLLTDVREAMVNLFVRNYFVTITMKKMLQTDRLRGVMSILMMSMVFLDAEVTAIGPPPFPRTAGPTHELDGVTIEFRVPGSARTKRVIYYSFDASNKGLTNYPEFVKYLRGLAPTTTLVKSASYLMHVSEFKRMRDVVLDTSAFLVQDDTGLPYSLLIERGWKLRPYGRYGVPIAPFERHYQTELAAAFEASKPEPLPFRFGYQRDKGENYSNLVVGQRSQIAHMHRSNAR